jgi:hypothetical protein
MKFMLPRNRTIASTCGIAIEFKKGELHLVPPAMYAEVIAAGGVPETELADDELPGKPATPEAVAEREAALFKAFEKLSLRNTRTDFTAGGMPHLGVLKEETGWSVEAKERDAAWVKFQAKAGDQD